MNNYITLRWITVFPFARKMKRSKFAILIYSDPTNYYTVLAKNAKALHMAKFRVLE